MTFRGFLKRRFYAALFVLAAVVAGLAAGNQAGTAARAATQWAAADDPPVSLVQAVDRIVAQPRYQHSVWGIAVGDLNTGQSLFHLNADKMCSGSA